MFLTDPVTQSGALFGRSNGSLHVRLRVALMLQMLMDKYEGVFGGVELEKNRDEARRQSQV